MGVGAAVAGAGNVVGACVVVSDVVAAAADLYGASEAPRRFPTAVAVLAEAACAPFEPAEPAAAAESVLAATACAFLEPAAPAAAAELVLAGAAAYAGRPSVGHSLAALGFPAPLSDILASLVLGPVASLADAMSMRSISSARSDTAALGLNVARPCGGGTTSPCDACEACDVVDTRDDAEYHTLELVLALAALVLALELCVPWLLVSRAELDPVLAYVATRRGVPAGGTRGRLKNGCGARGPCVAWRALGLGDPGAATARSLAGPGVSDCARSREGGGGGGRGRGRARGGRTRLEAWGPRLGAESR